MCQQSVVEEGVMLQSESLQLPELAQVGVLHVTAAGAAPVAPDDQLSQVWTPV